MARLNEPPAQVESVEACMTILREMAATKALLMFCSEETFRQAEPRDCEVPITLLIFELQAE